MGGRIMKNLIYKISILFALVLLSCSKEETFVPAQPEAANRITTLTGRSPYGSKLSFGEQDGDSLPFLWSRADQLGLFVTAGGIDVPSNQNVPAMIDKTSGPGASGGIFRAGLTGLTGSTSYNLRIYYPYYVNGGVSGSAIHNRIASHQVQAAPGSSSHISRCGGFATTISSFATPANVDGFKPEVEFELNHKTAYVWFKVSAAAGNYTGWTLKRITMTAPEGYALAGETTWDASTGSYTLDAVSKGLSNSVVLDIAEGEALSTSVQEAFMVVFPTSVASQTLTLEYTLTNPAGTQTVTLGHTRTVGPSSAMFAPGKIYRLTEQIPAAAGGEWTETEYSVDVESYRSALAEIMRRCNIPDMLLTYKDNLVTIDLAIHNEDFYSLSTLYGSKTPAEWYAQINPLTTSSILQACSISKVPFSYIVCKMADDGEIDLDTPLYTYYPGILDKFASDETTQARAKKVTPRMCLSHVSGLNNSTYSNSAFSFEPGDKFQYSGVGMAMLQWTVEHIKGSTLDVLAKSYIFDRTGMTHSNYLWQDEFESSHMYGFRSSGTQRNQSWSGGKCNAAYSLRTNSVEYTRFLQWFIDGGDLSPEMYAELTSPQINIGENRYRALGWVLEENPEMGKMFLHTGNNVSFQGNSVIVPERHASLCYFWNITAKYGMNGPIFKLFFQNEYPTGTYGTGTIPDSAGSGDNGGAGSGVVYYE